MVRGKRLGVSHSYSVYEWLHSDLAPDRPMLASRLHALFAHWWELNRAAEGHVPLSARALSRVLVEEFGWTRDVFHGRPFYNKPRPEDVHWWDHKAR